MVIKFNQNLEINKEEEVPPFGNILAFDLDLSITNDVESYYHDDDNPEKW